MDVAAHAPGTVRWIDIGAPDPGAAAAFYGALFGWIYTDSGTDGYQVALPTPQTAVRQVRPVNVTSSTAARSSPVGTRRRSSSPISGRADASRCGTPGLILDVARIELSGGVRPGR